MLQSPHNATASLGNRDRPGREPNRRAVNAACGFGAFSVAMFALFTVRLVVGMNAVPAGSQVFMSVAVIAAIVVTLLLLAGTVTMWTRQPIGQLLLIPASALGIAYAVSFTVYNYFHGPDVYGGGDVGMVVVQALFGVAPPLVALLCAARDGSARR